MAKRTKPTAAKVPCTVCGTLTSGISLSPGTVSARCEQCHQARQAVARGDGHLPIPKKRRTEGQGGSTSRSKAKKRKQSKRRKTTP